MTEPARKPVVLVCEDELALLDDVCAVLRESGYEPIGVASAEEALERLEQQSPDLIVTDIGLPGMDGMALLRHVRQQRLDLDAVPFIILTAFADHMDVSMGKRAGADDYLVKPVDYDLLLATIESHLRTVERLQRHDHSQQDQLGVFLEQVLDRMQCGLGLITREGRGCHLNLSGREMTGGRAGQLRQWLADKLGDVALADVLRDARDALVRGRAFDHAVLLEEGGPDDGETDMATGWTVIVFSTLEGTGGLADDPALMVMIVTSDCAVSAGGRLVARAAGLTVTETEVALMLADGARPLDIAKELQITKATVTYHLRNIFRKTATSRQADLVMLLRALPLYAHD